MYKLHDREFLVVRDNDTLDIGGKTLKFIETPYLHTEETMITYCEEDKILFPCDIFSTHVANYEYFNDIAKEDIKADYIGYYKLIMHPHRRYAQNMIEKIKDLGIKIIAPSHGFIIRINITSSTYKIKYKTILGALKEITSQYVSILGLIFSFISITLIKMLFRS